MPHDNASHRSLAALLQAGEPPACSVMNSDGCAPMLLICDHASNRVPTALGRLGLPPAELERHIGWDIGAAKVAEGLSRRFDAPLVLSNYSRLVIDCNRRTFDTTAIAECSDGTLIPANQGLSDDARQARVDVFHAPYHGRIRAFLDDFAQAGITPAVLAVHSFTPVMGGKARPWQVGVLWDKDPRIALPLLDALRAWRGAGGEALVVGDNEPYSARDPEGYSMAHHAQAPGLAHVSLEIRQDLIATPEGAVLWVKILSLVLEPILADPGLYCLQGV